MSQPIDKGPFYHGTRANLQIGDLLTPGRTSNYQSALVMNHIYFTALVNSAGLAAALALGEGAERVYIVEPTDSFEDDPNVTNKKFPGNLTRSYRTRAPLKIIGEVTDWLKQTPEQIQQWRGKLADNKGEIIN
ncbi:NAD(+)--rifampin ADP-ribosyltransferase [Pedobacter sp. KACC 23697]|uniref:NAD(+)--rifampin ADP-ribosyltransferase n=1 Tax=Pedobacter sp. KACC 23697 TaxID=3149230 RepID=A0AAU7KBH3_9SPHI